MPLVELNSNSHDILLNPSKEVSTSFLLPEEFVCTHCVLQWRFTEGDYSSVHVKGPPPLPPVNAIHIALFKRSPYCDLLPIDINNKIKYNFKNIQFPKSVTYNSRAQWVIEFTTFFQSHEFESNWSFYNFTFPKAFQKFGKTSTF